MKYLVFSCGALLLALSGCSSGPTLRSTVPATQSGIQQIDAARLPVPAGADPSGAVRPYAIGPYDKLKIQVFGIEELADQQVQVDAQGGIAIPLAGAFKAAGKAPAELSREIAERLRRYVREPQVAVNLMETVSQTVAVDGDVQKPGLYPVYGQMTLMKAVASAQGLTEMARPEEVAIFRTVDGQKYAGLYDLRAIRQGNYQDPEIFADDVVVVGHSARRQLFKDALSVVPAFLTPLIYLLR